MSGKYHYEGDPEMMKRFILQPVGKSRPGDDFTLTVDNGDEMPELESRRM